MKIKTRKIVARKIKLSGFGFVGVGFLLTFAVTGSVWALQANAQAAADKDKLTCAAGPAISTASRPKKSTLKEESLLDSTSRAVFRADRQLKKKSDAGAKNELKQQAKERKDSMLNQMRTNPDNALRQVLNGTEQTNAQALTKGCVETPVTVKGSVEIINTDFENHTSKTDYVLRTANKERLYLHPAKQNKKVQLKSGQQLQIKGYQLDKDVLFDASAKDSVTTAQAPPAAPWGTSVAHAAGPDTTGPQQTIVLMAYFQGTSQPSLTKATVDNIVFTQMNNYYQETSHNQVSVAGTSKNWVQIPISPTCDTDAVTDAAIDAADPTVNFANYSRIMIVTNFPGCGFTGLGSIGKWSIQTADGTINASISWITPTNIPQVYVHEYGHNFGLGHANFFNCGSSTIKLSGCTSEEYYDIHSPMGFSDPLLPHMNAPEKELLDWISPSHVKTVTASGNYTIEPLETTPSAFKTMKLQRNNGEDINFVPLDGYSNSYYEFRTATGSDSGLNANVLSGALLHNYSPNYDDYTELLDATPPGDEDTPALPVGSTFIDPATASQVTLTSKTASAMNFNVAMGKTDFSVPTISLTAEPFESNISGNIDFTATASAPSGIQKVEFYVDRVPEDSSPVTPAFTDTTAPFQYHLDTRTLTDGSHYVDVVATDKSGEPFGVPGNQVQDVDGWYLNVQNDPTPPTVSITAPANGATVSGSSVAINANAADNVGVTKVEFYVDGVLKNTDTVSPYSYAWDSTVVTNGSHALIAKAYDAAGNVTSSSTITVTSSNVDSTPPTISITAPSNGATVSASGVAINATAADNLGVTKVEFYVDGTLINTDTVSPYSYAWDSNTVANGAHTLTAKAYDGATNVTTSSPISITVSNIDNVTPSVSITAPSEGATVSGNVAVNATASDNVGVVSVAFYVDNVLKSTDTISPYSYTWDSTTVANGSHFFTARALDAQGNIGSTSPTNITVANAATLGVSLATTPSSGAAPLNSVSLQATNSGTATGNATYTFYCNRSDSGTNVTPGYIYQTTNSGDSFGVSNACNYSSAGSYTAKVIVQRASLASEARATVSVTRSSSNVPLLPWSPAAVAQTSGKINVFSRGTDNRLWQTWYENGSWQTWNYIDGLSPASSASTAISWGNGHMDVFETRNGEVWHSWYSAAEGWHGWSSLGKPASASLGGSIAVVTQAPGKINVFARGNDGRLWQNWFDGHNWQTNWNYIDGPSPTSQSPSAVSWADGHMDVFEVRNGNVWHSWYSAAEGWHGWQPLGRPSAANLTKSVALVSQSVGKINLFARGEDGRLWQTWYENGSWQTWNYIDGLSPASSAPSAISWGNGHMDVFEVNNGGLRHSWYNADATGWRGWEDLGRL